MPLVFLIVVGALGIGGIYYLRLQRALLLQAEENIPAQNNLSAFLTMIRTAEGANYYTLYGGQSFLELDTHPAVRSYGEFLKPGVIDYTTAAGAYQITFTTWKRLTSKLGVADFGINTQDQMAKELIREKGAMQDVIDGNFDEAVRKVSGVWASLPFSTVPQPHHTLETVARIYQSNGGVISV